MYLPSWRCPICHVCVGESLLHQLDHLPSRHCSRTRCIHKLFPKPITALLKRNISLNVFGLETMRKPSHSWMLSDLSRQHLHVRLDPQERSTPCTVATFCPGGRLALLYVQASIRAASPPELGEAEKLCLKLSLCLSLSPSLADSNPPSPSRVSLVLSPG